MIVPALLTDNKDEFIRMLNTCQEFAPYVQIDIMDGEFVSSKSIDMADVKGLKYPLRSEAHLMVEDPLRWIVPFKEFGSERIIFHYEIQKDKEEVIGAIRSHGLQVGLAVNPGTSIDEFRHLVEKIDGILFLSVVPGFYGSQFMPQVLEKIKEFKVLYPRTTIGIDGGIKMDNMKEISRLGIDYICIGSALMKHASPKEAYQKLLEVISG